MILRHECGGNAARRSLGACCDRGGTAADTVLKFNQGAGSIHVTNSTLEWSQSITPLDMLGKGACTVAYEEYASTKLPRECYHLRIKTYHQWEGAGLI